MQQLLCESEDRLGSQASSSTMRPNSQIINARRSGFVATTSSVDGAELIMVGVFQHRKSCLLFFLISEP
jgi:protein-serine/threonine kinase